MADAAPQTNNDNSASVPVESDKEIPYQVREHPFTPPGQGIGLPGHTNTADGARVRAQAAARYQTAQAQAQAKHDQQFRADTRQRGKKGR